MAFFRAYIKTNLQIVAELLPSVKKDCGGCLPSALIFEESVQRFPEFRDKKNFVVSLLTCDHVESLHQEVLIDVWVLHSLKEVKESQLLGEDVNTGGFEEPHPMTIYLTKKLRDYHQSALDKERCVLLRGVTPVPIKKITMGALSVESFEWATRNLKKFLINSVRNRLVIMKQNGNLGEMFVQSELYHKLSMIIVLECVPVMQGLVTAETMVVISDIHRDSMGKWQLKRLKSMQGSGIVPHPPLLKMPAQTINMDEPDGGGIFCNSKGEVLDKLQVSLLEFPFHCQSLPLIDQVADVENQVWITMKTMTDMQLNIGSWVRVFISSSNQGVPNLETGSPVKTPSEVNPESKDDTFRKIKLAQVFPVEGRRTMECIWQSQSTMIENDKLKEFQNGTAYISPSLLFNLLHSPLVDRKSVMLCIERAELRESPPSFAKEINISVITSPVTRISTMYDFILTHHFTTPKLVSVGDVLCVYCDWKKLDTPNTQAALDEGRPRNHFLYFKVDKLVGEDEESLSYFVDARHSKLFQVCCCKLKYVVFLLIL